MDPNNILEMKGICKAFTGVKALQDVDFSIRQGEVHALMGENGAGKSTLIKILTGVYSKDAGTMFFDGREINPATPLEAQHEGISTIYQELNMIPYLSIAENIFLGREPKKRGIIDWKKIQEEAAKLLKDSLGIEIDVRKILCDCSTAVAQMTALARAISINSKLVVMDEATSSLNDAEVNKLFEIINILKSKGISVIFISHKLDEIFKISDRVTVLKDGNLVGVRDVREITKLELVSMMIGRDASEIIRARREYKDYSQAEEYCTSIEVGYGNRLKKVTFNIRKGEVVGLAGLLGSGRTEFAKALFGAEKYKHGEITVKGKPVKYRIPKHAIKDGMGFCSEDRKAEGIMPHLTIRENLSMAILPRFSGGGIIQENKVTEIVDQYIERLRIKTPSQQQLIRNLSGGNQQKILLARWLCMSPELIILDEPTRGIDVGAKAEIEEVIQELSAEGMAVLYISSEIEELVRGCDRVIVLKEGYSVSELAGENITQSNLLAAIAGSKKETDGRKPVQ
ncbi:MAG TPA: sugar ABC transporter ATP-binding protein [Anaerovoracaceae bacterium]|nr:sugar ABC transporter ATP-binding protein [Anaerovoracaceae bacterium]